MRREVHYLLVVNQITVNAIDPGSQMDLEGVEAGTASSKILQDLGASGATWNSLYSWTSDI